jgi:hypothetical protein
MHRSAGLTSTMLAGLKHKLSTHLGEAWGQPIKVERYAPNWDSSLLSFSELPFLPPHVLTVQCLEVSR